jgi:hypothetical protein
MFQQMVVTANATIRGRKEVDKVVGRWMALQRKDLAEKCVEPQECRFETRLVVAITAMINWTV